MNKHELLELINEYIHENINEDLIVKINQTFEDNFMDSLDISTMLKDIDIKEVDYPSPFETINHFVERVRDK